MENWIKKNDKIIVVPNRLIDESGKIAHANNFGLIEIMDREKVNFNLFTQIDIMKAISRGLINRKGDEIVWGLVMSPVL